MRKILHLLIFLAIGYAEAQYMENAPWMQNPDTQAKKNQIL